LRQSHGGQNEMIEDT